MCARVRRGRDCLLGTTAVGSQAVPVGGAIALNDMASGAGNRDVGSGDDDGVKVRVEGGGEGLGVKSAQSSTQCGLGGKKKERKRTYSCAVERDGGALLELLQVDGAVCGRGDVGERDVGAGLDRVGDILELGNGATGLEWANRGSVWVPFLGRSDGPDGG